MQPPRIQTTRSTRRPLGVFWYIEFIYTVEAIVCTHHDSLPYRSVLRTPRRVWAGYWAKNRGFYHE